MKILVLFLILLISSPLAASEAHYYQVSLLRAAPGNMPSLIDAVKARKAEQESEMIIMRHSQGDHWDLMLLFPVTKVFPNQISHHDKVSFQHDFIASSGSDWKTIKTLAMGSGLFHIEMFQAADGRYQNLLQQRVRENKYLRATKREPNLIFTTHFGSDVDVFTLGFYKDMAAFASEPDLAPEVFEQAAVDAGFKSRSDIGFNLREFLIGHQDTLATKID